MKIKKGDRPFVAALWIWKVFMDEVILMDYRKFSKQLMLEGQG